ncbi:hypothetical protein [Myroides marinus]|uniref:hypothetical protein n=1 Tax=Myroides marinus TaxID=703342 RepID=UPI0025788D4D|nr:hypothetical protein [Myroides marinus]MDM1369789.1 hypothetical protein [Myroides marinus]MDM1371439.1 hypothetical protein [Myroides marinus]
MGYIFLAFLVVSSLPIIIGFFKKSPEEKEIEKRKIEEEKIKNIYLKETVDFEINQIEKANKLKTLPLNQRLNSIYSDLKLNSNNYLIEKINQLNQDKFNEELLVLYPLLAYFIDSSKGKIIEINNSKLEVEIFIGTQYEKNAGIYKIKYYRNERLGSFKVGNYQNIEKAGKLFITHFIYFNTPLLSFNEMNNKKGLSTNFTLKSIYQNEIDINDLVRIDFELFKLLKKFNN